jgi:hypothetical protein
VVDWLHEYAIDQQCAVGDRRAAPPARTTETQGWTPAQDYGSRCLDGHRLCLEEWDPVGDAASGAGLWERHDVLAALA